MRAFAERGYDLVIGVGFAQAPIMQTVARDYPNIHFAIIDGVILEDDGKTPMPNVASLVFKEHEGSYLVGMIAAHDLAHRHPRVRRRHGHPADPPLREGIRGGREGGESARSRSSRTTSA